MSETIKWSELSPEERDHLVDGKVMGIREIAMQSTRMSPAVK